MAKKARAGRPQAERKARQKARQKAVKRVKKAGVGRRQEAEGANVKQLTQLRNKVQQLQRQLEALRNKGQKGQKGNPRASEARLLRWRVELPENAPAELAVTVVYVPKTGSPTHMELTPDITDIQQKTGRERVGTWTATISDNVRYKLEHDSGRVMLFGKTMPVVVVLRVLPNTPTI